MTEMASVGRFEWDILISDCIHRQLLGTSDIRMMPCQFVRAPDTPTTPGWRGIYQESPGIQKCCHFNQQNPLLFSLNNLLYIVLVKLIQSNWLVWWRLAVFPWCGCRWSYIMLNVWKHYSLTWQGGGLRRPDLLLKTILAPRESTFLMSPPHSGQGHLNWVNWICQLVQNITSNITRVKSKYFVKIPKR